MRFAITICALLLMPLLYGQKIYCDIYTSLTVRLSLDSDGKFRLTSSSAESMYDPDDLPDLCSPPVIWSEGSYSKQGEIIVCKDYNGNGTFRLLKQQNGDRLMLFDAFWLDGKSPLKSENIYDGEKAYSATLLTLLPRYTKFYIRMKEVFNGQQHKMLRVYMWENGKKQQIFQRDE